MPEVITDNLDLWTSALLTKSTAGRGSNGKLEAYGIKKLRELILELAVRGKLVPQDPNDEPASVLLKNIADEKVQLRTEKRIRKQEILPEIEAMDAPHELPVGWAWARLGDICTKLTDGSHNPPSDAGEGYPMLSSQNVFDGKIDFQNPSRFVSEDDFEKENQRTQIMPNDVLLTIVASLGRSAVVPDNAPMFVLQRSVAVLQSRLAPRFFALQLVSPHCLRYYDLNAKGTAQKGIYLGKLALMGIAVPPLFEQHRIVAKVDELMALCDQLEQQQTHSLEAHQTLVETLLGTLTRVESQQEFSVAWARIASHFDTLFTTEASIDQLKQTILQLAVMGKLVPQDPNDESASVLLKRITEAKERLVKKGLLKKQLPLTEVTDAEMPFEIPDKWEWSRLGNLGIGNTGKTPSTGNPEYYDGEIPFIGPGQITPAGEILDSDKYLTESGCEYSTVAEPGDVLMVCIGGSIGKSAITVSRVAFNQQINCIRPIFVSPVLLNFTMNTPHFQSAVLEKATGSATPIINRSKWEELLVPVPPEAEQHRIVAKVDELMAVCDALKARLADTQAIQLHLADAIVEQAVC